MQVWAFDLMNKIKMDFFSVKINTKNENDMSLVLDSYIYCILLSLECLKSSCHSSLHTLNRAHSLYAHDWHSKSTMCTTLRNSMSAYWTQKMPPSFMQFLYNGGKNRFFFFLYKFVKITIPLHFSMLIKCLKPISLGHWEAWI